ncbi:hypothetical protein Salat_2090600 [Sesamum alatum]|uniref:Reverse transcriptase zinc-binding domain-containing protein n=1 Tax=Sesamum alatum TaxID=300844 RepID=A0AAE2CGI4_9LAMI|nr:hypothetical protein Salat_2090600 [Sesamum alatum]
MWDKLLELGQPLSMPWLILGDFNCVKSPEEKQFGVVPTWYELKDFVDCCLALGLHDAPTTSCYFTWSSNNDNNPVWCKLDRVLLNNEWLEAGLHCGAHFSPPGCLSDHSPGIVSLFDPPAPKPKPFRFFNMWADHPDFLATVESHWSMNVEGTAQFSLCRKLKVLKGPLKAFNNLHYSHISVRAKEADLALQDAQVQLESDPENVTIRGSLGYLRKKATFLAEAERQFYYQKAKIHHLKMGDKNTKFFHDMVKRNTARSSIMAISKSDGSTITSAEDIGREFTDYFTLLLGTEARTLPVDNDVFEWGPKLSTEHALELYTLWVQWVNSVYLRGSSIWDWQPKKGDSPLLRRLADIRDRLITAFGTTGTAVESMTAWSSLKGLQTSKAYEYFRPKCARQPWKAAIWRAFIPPKYSFILWLGLRGRLATRDRLDFLDEEHSCSLCINTMESTGHLFFACPFSDHVWSNIRQWLGITRHMSTLHSAIKWLKKEKMGSSVQNKARTLALACTVYSLWRHRNEIIFESKAPNPDGLIACIKITVCRIIFALFPYGF